MMPFTTFLSQKNRYRRNRRVLSEVPIVFEVTYFFHFLEKHSKSPSDTSSSSSQREPKLDAPKTAKARASGQLRQANNKTPPLIDFGSSTTSTTAAPAPSNKKKAADPKKKEWDDDAWDLLNN